MRPEEGREMRAEGRGSPRTAWGAARAFGRERKPRASSRGARRKTHAATREAECEGEGRADHARANVARPGESFKFYCKACCG